MIAPKPAAATGPVAEVHHGVPRCLLRLRDRAEVCGLTGEGIELEMEFGHEARRWGVGPEIGREELAAMVEASAMEVPAEEHRATHSARGDFAEWGRRGGLETLRRYGRPYFALLRRRRCGLDADELAGYRAVRLAVEDGGRS